MKTLTENLLAKARKSKDKVIELDGTETALFYDERHIWEGDIVVKASMGEEVQLPWRPLPTRMHAEERYFVNGTEIKPAFGFWGLGNRLRGIGNVN